jgi:polyisoprenoid-binding protein YceI
MWIFKCIESSRGSQRVAALVVGFLLLGPSVWAGGPSDPNTRRFSFDQDRSSVHFSVSSTFHRIEGQAREFKGEVLFHSLTDPASGRLTVEIDASQLDANQRGINRKMREDCLEVDRFPLIRFESLEIRHKPQNYVFGRIVQGEAVGVLELHGLRRRIGFPIEYGYTEDNFNARGRVTIKMSEFEIPDPAFLFLRIGDEVQISFDIHASASGDPGNLSIEEKNGSLIPFQ